MINYTYKQQGDGRDSWIAEEIKDGVVVNKYMVYEDPTKVDLSRIDINSLSEEQINALKQKLGLS